MKMRIVRHWQDWPDAARGAAMALGNFDGLHLGHRAVIAAMRSIAEKQRIPSAVMTFEPHPRRVFAPHLPPLRLVPFQEKARLLAKMGVEYLFVQRFTRAYAATHAEEFLQEILLKKLGVRQVVTGENFAFGHERRGNAGWLKDQASLGGSFGFTALPPVMAAGEICSSTAIRCHLEMAEIKQAEALLGHPYEVIGRVKKGDQRGRTIGFPTLNLVPSCLFLPISGVYAVEVRLAGEVYSGVANLGVRPTFGGQEKRLEIHCFAALPELYGSRLRVRLMERLREERRFDGIDALRLQIEQDVSQAKRVLG